MALFEGKTPAERNKLIKDTRKALEAEIADTQAYLDDATERMEEVWKTFQEMKDYSGEGIGGVVGLILAIFIGFVNPFIMSAEVGHLYGAEGQEPPPVTGVTGLWILLPIVGTFIWLAKTQNALSAFWEAHGAVGP